MSSIRNLFIILAMSLLLSTAFSQLPQSTAQGGVWTDQQVYSVGQTITVHFDPPVSDYSAYPHWCLSQTLMLEGPYSDTIDLSEYPPGTSSLVLGQADPGDVGTWKVSYFGLSIPDTYGEGHCPFYSVMPAVTYFTVVGGSADLVVQNTWVNPGNPLQEDMVSFSAGIANIGGGDASGFRVEVYLDGSLWDSGTASLAAGDSTTFTSDRQYRAEDGSHSVRWVVNPDRSVQESNYGNNEGSTSFFVNPRTITATVTVTETSTRIQTQRVGTTIVVMRTVTVTRTMDTAVQGTVTAKAVTVTRTLTGLSTSTIYSPTVTTTVTALAQIVSNPASWLVLCTLGVIGAVLQLPKGRRTGRFYRWVIARFSLPSLGRHHVKKVLISLCLIAVIALSISAEVNQVIGSTITITRTVTVAEWVTLIESLTETQYVTSTLTETSWSTRTSTGFVTVTPAVTVTVDHRSTTLTHVPTTLIRTVTKTTATGEEAACPFTIIDNSDGTTLVRICAKRIEEIRSAQNNVVCGSVIGWCGHPKYDAAWDTVADIWGHVAWSKLAKILQNLKGWAKDVMIDDGALTWLDRAEFAYSAMQEIRNNPTLLAKLRDAIGLVAEASIDSVVEKGISTLVDVSFAALTLYMVAVGKTAPEAKHSDGSIDIRLQWLTELTYEVLEKTVYAIGAAFYILAKQALEKQVPERTGVSLQEPLHKLYLLVFDSSGRYVGFDRTKGELVNQIPGASYSDLGNSIVILLPPGVSEYRYIVDARDAQEPKETYRLVLSSFGGGEAAMITESSIAKGTQQEHSVVISPVDNVISVDPNSFERFWSEYKLTAMSALITALLVLVSSEIILRGQRQRRRRRR